MAARVGLCRQRLNGAGKLEWAWTTITDSLRRELSRRLSRSRVRDLASRDDQFTCGFKLGLGLEARINLNCIKSVRMSAHIPAMFFSSVTTACEQPSKRPNRRTGN